MEALAMMARKGVAVLVAVLVAMTVLVIAGSAGTGDERDTVTIIGGDHIDIIIDSTSKQVKRWAHGASGAAGAAGAGETEVSQAGALPIATETEIG